MLVQPRLHTLHSLAHVHRSPALKNNHYKSSFELNATMKILFLFNSLYLILSARCKSCHLSNVSKLTISETQQVVIWAQPCKIITNSKIVLYIVIMCLSQCKQIELIKETQLNYRVPLKRGIYFNINLPVITAISITCKLLFITGSYSQREMLLLLVNSNKKP